MKGSARREKKARDRRVRRRRRSFLSRSRDSLSADRLARREGEAYGESDLAFDLVGKPVFTSSFNSRPLFPSAWYICLQRHRRRRCHRRGPMWVIADGDSNLTMRGLLSVARARDAPYFKFREKRCHVTRVITAPVISERNRNFCLIPPPRLRVPLSLSSRREWAGLNDPLCPSRVAAFVLLTRRIAEYWPNTAAVGRLVGQSNSSVTTAGPLANDRHYLTNESRHGPRTYLLAPPLVLSFIPASPSCGSAALLR